MANPDYLLPAYACNILLLVPVCFGMFFGRHTAGVFQGRVEESEGLRLLVGSLWFAILCGSIAGLFQPERFAPILLLQIVYKTVWLVSFALPRLLGGRKREIPPGVAGSFLLIVLAYPVLLWLAAGSLASGLEGADLNSDLALSAPAAGQAAMAVSGAAARLLFDTVIE